MGTAGSLKAHLLAEAAIREDFVVVSGQKVWIREVDPVSFSEYGDLLKKDRIMATAGLLAACVIDDKEGERLFDNAEEALPLARSSRTSLPLIQKIMELSGFGEDDVDEGLSQKEDDAN